MPNPIQKALAVAATVTAANAALAGLPVVRTVQRTERLTCSPSGNPRWRVTFTDGLVLTTKRDHQFNYEIGLQMEGRTYQLETDGRVLHGATHT